MENIVLFPRPGRIIKPISASLWIIRGIICGPNATIIALITHSMTYLAPLYILWFQQVSLDKDVKIISLLKPLEKEKKLQNTLFWPTFPNLALTPPKNVKSTQTPPKPS